MIGTHFTEEDRNGAYRELLRSPTFFCTALLGLRPFPYQIPLLEDQSKRIIVCAGRRTGKSLICSGKGLWFAFTHPGSSTIIVSATQRQSSLMFDKIMDFIGSSEELMDSVARKTRTLIRFKIGSSITALPCGHDGYFLRGANADLAIIDEASFVPEKVITEVINPMLATTGGFSILISTPFDRNHYFYKAYSNPNYSKYHFRTRENPLVGQDFLEEQREQIGEIGYRREYEAEFVDDDSTYFPTALLRSCVHVCGAKKGACSYCRIALDPVSEPHGEYFAGYDVGGLKDPAALVVIERVRIVDPEDASKRRTVYRVVLTKTFLSGEKGNERSDVYTKFTIEVSELHKKMHFERLLVDQTGVGSPIVSHLQELKLPATGMVFTSNTKQSLFSNMKIMFEGKRVVLPEGIDLVSSLNCIVAKANRQGNYIFDHLRGTHDDLACALALALWSATQNSGVVVMMTDKKEATNWRAKLGESL